MRSALEFVSPPSSLSSRRTATMAEIPCIACVSKAREPNATPEAVNAAAKLHTRETISCHLRTVYPHHNYMCDICTYDYGLDEQSGSVLSFHLRSAHNEPGLDLPRSRYYKWWKCGTGGFD